MTYPVDTAAAVSAYAGEPDRSPPVSRALQSLHKECTVLNDALLRLGNALGPVLDDETLEDPRQVLAQARELYQVPIAREVEEIAERVAAQTRLCESLLQRLGI